MKHWLWKVLLAGCVVIGGSALLVWYSLNHRAVDPGLAVGVRRVVRLHPQLQSLFDRATSDGVLTMSEANEILGAAEKLQHH